MATAAAGQSLDYYGILAAPCIEDRMSLDGVGHVVHLRGGLLSCARRRSRARKPPR